LPVIDRDALRTHATLQDPPAAGRVKILQRRTRIEIKPWHAQGARSGFAGSSLSITKALPQGRPSLSATSANGTPPSDFRMASMTSRIRTSGVPLCRQKAFQIRSATASAWCGLVQVEDAERH